MPTLTFAIRKAIGQSIDDFFCYRFSWRIFRSALRHTIQFTIENGKIWGAARRTPRAISRVNY